MIFRPNDDLSNFRASFWERISPLEAAVLIILMFAVVGMIEDWLCGWPCK